MGITVGVTFYIHEGERSIWVNGGHQNAVFLVDQLKRCPGVDRVIAVNGGPGERPDKKMLLDGIIDEFPRFDTVADELDLYIECGAQIPAAHAERVHSNGGRVVAYKFGNAFVLDAEKLCAGKGDQMIFNGTKFDAVWTTRQHMATNASYWRACYRCPVVCLPHVWAPTFTSIAQRESGNTFGYVERPRPNGFRIAIYEPNYNIVKMCHVPMLVCELAYRDHPELIDSVWVTNTDRLRDQLTFQRFHNTLDICKDRAADGMHVCTCESRFNLIGFQAKNADVCVSWQWENALNYAYYELLWGHYPLIHNSHLLPNGVGYRYSGFDAHDGAAVLTRALRNHNPEAYGKRADRFIATLLPSNKRNIRAHQSAIDALWGRDVPPARRLYYRLLRLLLSLLLFYRRCGGARV